MTVRDDDDTIGRVRIALTNVPDRDTAQRIAQALIDEHLAACVNILAPCRSVYRWQGAVEEAEEIPLLIKTRVDRIDALRERLLALHPYDLPELIAWQPRDAHVPYAQWVIDEAAPPGE